MHNVAEAAYAYISAESVSPHSLVCALQAIDDKSKKEVDEAVAHAKNDPEPSPEELYTHVYSQPPPGYQVRGCDPFTYYSTK